LKASDRQVAGSHYRQFKIQPLEFIHRNGLSFPVGCIVKYACRHDRKGGAIDVHKIIHYAQLLLEMDYPDDQFDYVRVCKRCGAIAGDDHACEGK
jgi:hypothetical protein